ncbi:MAG: ArdC family protein [Fimbriimonas sp.]
MNAAYEAVTARIVEALERETVPWRKPWNGSPLPVNAVSKRPYRGVNVFLLGLGMFRDYRWLTFKQARQMGGYVREGERSMIAIFWKPIGLDRTDPETGEIRRDTVPLLRYYHVFNAEQCEGLRLPALPRPEPEAPALRIERAEALVRAMPDPPTIREGGSSAWYSPGQDLIQVPHLRDFRSSDAFYATLFHEMGHATGHERRLNRPGVTGTVRFGSENYGREELVAELASAFLCAHSGLENSLESSSADYIAGWLDAIRSDPKAVVIAAAQAQRAADFVLGVRSEV